MSNPSLREQLEALAKGSGSDADKRSRHPAGARSSVKKEKKLPVPRAATPAWLEQARYGVELLKVHFPKCFGERDAVRPLKTGIREDLVRELGAKGDIAIGDKACMLSSLAYYVNSASYHKCVQEGADRYDLQGNGSGKVTADEARYSKSRLEARQQKRRKVTPVAQPVEKETG